MKKLILSATLFPILFLALGAAGAVTYTGKFVGDSSSLTNLPASAIVSPPWLTGVPATYALKTDATNAANNAVATQPLPAANLTGTASINTAGASGIATNLAAAPSVTLLATNITGSGTMDTKGNLILNLTASGGGVTTNLVADYVTNIVITFITTNLNQWILSGSGDTNINSTYVYAGNLTATNSYYTNSQNGNYLLVSNAYFFTLLGKLRVAWLVTNTAISGTNGMLYYGGAQIFTNQTVPDYPAGTSGQGIFSKLSDTNTPPGGFFSIATNYQTNVYSYINPVIPINQAKQSFAVIDPVYGDDTNAPYGKFFATITGVNNYYSNTVVPILLNPGTVISPFGNNTYNYNETLKANQSLIGYGTLASYYDPYVATNFTFLQITNGCSLQNLTIGEFGNNNYSPNVNVSNITLVNVQCIGAGDCTGFGGAAYNFVCRRCDFVSQWDISQGVSQGSWYDCNFYCYVDPNSITVPNIFEGLHCILANHADGIYNVYGGTMQLVNATLATNNAFGVAANACVWVVAPAAVVNIYGTRMFHSNTNGIADYGVYFATNNSNVNGWWWDNGVLITCTNSIMTTNSFPSATVNQGTTNATALSSFTATFNTPFVDTKYTATESGNGFALAASYVSAKTTTNCVFNMTAATGLIDWVAIHK